MRPPVLSALLLPLALAACPSQNSAPDQGLADSGACLASTPMTSLYEGTCSAGSSYTLCFLAQPQAFF
jgi:hypothetical protein